MRWRRQRGSLRCARKLPRFCVGVRIIDTYNSHEDERVGSQGSLPWTCDAQAGMAQAWPAGRKREEEE